jgi:predicted dithiol-disulfide oxidoreductase (DUF899 family)
VLYQPDEKNPDGYLLPFHLDTHHTSSQAIPSTSHAWTVQHSAWNDGKMDNWLPAHRKADGDAVGPYTMGYHTYSAYARGLDGLWGGYQWLDRTPLGRNEADLARPWMRRDEY